MSIDQTSRRRGQWLPLWLGVTLLAVLAAAWPHGPLGMRSFRAPKELALIVGAVGALLLAPSRGWDVFDLLVTGWLGAGLASLVGAPHPGRIIEAATLGLCTVALAISGRGVPHLSRIVMCRYAAFVGGLLVALSVLAEASGAIALCEPGLRPGGLLGQRNAAAHVLAIVLPFGWNLASKSVRKKVMHCAWVVLMVMALVLTRSRTGWLASLVALFVMAVGTLWRKRSMPLVPHAAATAGVLLAMLLPWHLAWNSKTPFRDTARTLVKLNAGSGETRLLQSRTSLKLFAKHPLLGVGPGHWAVDFPKVAQEGMPGFEPGGIEHTTHFLSGDFAATLVERGLLGTILFAALLFGVKRAVGVAWRKRLDGDSDARESAYAMAGRGSLAAWVIISFGDAFFQLPHGIACVAVLHLGAIPCERPDLSGSLRLRMTSLIPRVSLCGLLAIGAVWQVRRMAAMVHAADRDAGSLRLAASLDPFEPGYLYDLARQALVAGDCASALPYLESLTRLLPNHRWPQRALERCQSN